jgi:hypothetical protein
MKKIAMIVLLGLGVTLTFNGCGAIQRETAKWTGDGSETCHDGVMYLQFTSGVSVKYNKDSSIATCK